MRKPYFIDKATSLNVDEIARATLPERKNTAGAAGLPEGSTKAETQRYTLVGPLCTPSDIIADKFDSEPLAVGDYLVVHQVGAYAITSSPGLFIGHGFPAEYLVTPAGVKQVGKQDSIDEMKRRYIDIEQELASESLRRVS